MIPFGNSTVTLLHKSANGYRRYTLTGCSWRMTESRSMIDKTRETSMQTTCRIPADQQAPLPGDLLILGKTNASADSEIDLVRLLDALRLAGKPAFRIQSVKDNRLNAPMPHWAAMGV